MVEEIGASTCKGCDVRKAPWHSISLLSTPTLVCTWIGKLLMRLAGFQPAINSPLSANEASSCEACSTLPYWVRLHSTTTYTLCTCKHTYTCNCVHVCTCSCKCTFKSVHLWWCTCRVDIFKCVWMFVELCVGLYTYTCMYVSHVHVYVLFMYSRLWMYVFMYSCTCIHVHVWMYMYM